MRYGFPLLALVAALALSISAVACGSDTGLSDEARATGTIEARESAVTRFTVEAAQTAAVITPTPPSSPTPSPAPTIGITGPSGTIVVTDSQAANREAIDELLARRSEAFSQGDIDGWYETCDPAIRESGKTGGSLERQYAAMRFEPGPENDFQFVAEQVMFAGDSGANVIWGLRAGENYISGIGGGPYVKVDGEWFSRGWGCIG